MRYLVALLVGIVVLGVGIYAFTPGATSLPNPALSTSAIAKGLAEKISPVISRELGERKDQIVANAGGLPARTAVKLGWGTAMREVPTLTEVGCSALLDNLGGMSVPQLAKMIAAHNKARGVGSHPSVTAACR